MPPNNRVFGLDLLRAMAIFFVVYDHGRHFLSWHPALKYVVFDGVSFFFVLSGFLIGRILLRTVTSDDFNGRMLVDFWIRRWCRTLPNYFLILTVLILSYSLMGKSLLEINIFSYFTFSQNFALPHPNFFPEAWSLAVEEWFYLIVPIPFYIATRINRIDRKKLIVWAIILVIGTVTLFRCYKAYEYGYISIQEWDLHIRKQVLTRLDGLMFGVLGAYLSIYHSRKWNNRAGLMCAFGISLIFFDKIMASSVVYLNYLNVTLVSLGTLLLLPYLSNWKRSNDLVTRTITYVSVISYSMYLVNLTLIQEVFFPLYKSFCSSCIQPSLTLYITYWVTTLGCASFLYYGFERHMTKIRDLTNTKSKIPEPNQPAAVSIDR